MNWHKKTIIKKVFALLVSILMTIVLAVLFVSAIKEEADGLFIFALLLLFIYPIHLKCREPLLWSSAFYFIIYHITHQ